MYVSFSVSLYMYPHIYIYIYIYILQFLTIPSGFLLSSRDANDGRVPKYTANKTRHDWYSLRFVDDVWICWRCLWLQWANHILSHHIQYISVSKHNEHRWAMDRQIEHFGCRSLRKRETKAWRGELMARTRRESIMRQPGASAIQSSLIWKGFWKFMGSE